MVLVFTGWGAACEAYENFQSADRCAHQYKQTQDNTMFPWNDGAWTSLTKP